MIQCVSLAYEPNSLCLRLCSFLDERTNNLLRKIGGLPPSQFWTIAEMNLGLLCPCLVTFGPLIKRWYVDFALNLSLSRVEQILQLCNPKHHQSFESPRN